MQTGWWVDGVCVWKFQFLSLSFYFILGKDLGLAFEIPPHMKNQALFPACVLKVSENPVRRGLLWP